MIAAFFPLAAFLGVFALTLRSLGHGFVALFAVGYFNGLVRANFLSVFTTFMFDAALLGLYLGFFAGRQREAAGVFSGAAGQWVLLLVAWPALLSLIPVNDFLVQLVALRATVWFLPVLLVATSLSGRDLVLIARGLAVLNLFALGGGVYVYQFGVESLYPENAVTQIIYLSRDVARFQYHRVPSIFLSSAAYGSAMLLSLPFLLGQAFGVRVGTADRVLAAVGVAAAVGGLLLCAGRTPVVLLGGATLVAWVCTRFNPAIGIAAVGLIGAGAAIAATNERFQRAASLEDTEYVSERLQASANESFFDLMAEYPAGAGMGSSAGTSIPFFLADRAPRAIGLENEYSRILVDQGLFGLLLWLAFLVWLLHRPPPLRLDCPWGFGVVLMFSLVLCSWATAFIGTGILSAIPASVLMLAQMGVLVRVRGVAAGGRQ